jgi:hypothetical protein
MQVAAAVAPVVLGVQVGVEPQEVVQLVRREQ